jgi:hypothetical protein
MEKIDQWPEWWSNDITVQWDGSWMESYPLQSRFQVASQSVPTAKKILNAHGYGNGDESESEFTVIPVMHNTTHSSFNNITGAVDEEGQDGDNLSLNQQPTIDFDTRQSKYQVMAQTASTEAGFTAVKLWMFEMSNPESWSELAGVNFRVGPTTKSIPAQMIVQVQSDQLPQFERALLARGFGQ